MRRIDLETVRFIAMLNELTTKLSNGCIPLSEFIENPSAGNVFKIVYNDKTGQVIDEIYNGIDDHHDPVTYYEKSFGDQVHVKVCEEECIVYEEGKDECCVDDDRWIEVTFDYSDDTIVIERISDTRCVWYYCFG